MRVIACQNAGGKSVLEILDDISEEDRRITRTKVISIGDVVEAGVHNFEALKGIYCHLSGNVQGKHYNVRLCMTVA